MQEPDWFKLHTGERGYSKIINLSNSLKTFKISELGYCTMAKKEQIQ